MLTQYEIDTIMKTLQSGEKVYLYYVTHMIESPKDLLNIDFYKCDSKFKVVKIEIKGVKNAYFEYLNYRMNPNDYHIESETCYYDGTGKRNNYYIVPNSTGPYESEINPRIPSVIYGHVNQEKYDESTGEITQKVDNSLIDFVYTNSITYGDCTPNEAFYAFVDGKLDWKYRKLMDAVPIDGVAYEYITSDWYVLDVKFPCVELPLINTHISNSYFMNLNDALGYMEQLEA